MQKVTLQAQVEAMQRHVDTFTFTCQIPEQRPPMSQPDAHNRSNLNQGRSMDYPPYYRQREESPVSSSHEKASLPTEVLDYYRHGHQQPHANQRYHEVRSLEYGDSGIFYQQPYPDTHSRPNGVYYHPYSSK
jgi:hypothetical protein